MRAGLFVWGGWLLLFVAYELPAHYRWVPWPTLSSTSWDLEAQWRPVRLIFLVFLVVLLAHICFRLSAVALLVVIGSAAVALTAHFLTV